jgi:transcriptional regulator with XRE-family HTH domain
LPFGGNAEMRLPESGTAASLNSDYSPLVYRRYRIRISLLAQPPNRQIHPPSGPEKAFGQALREIREGRKFSQEGLALEAGLDRTYISLIERGVRSPTIRTLVKLAEVLNVRPAKIVERMDALLAKGRKHTPKAEAEAAPPPSPRRQHGGAALTRARRVETP